VQPFGPVVIRRTALSDSVGVAICILGLFVAIWSRKVLGAEWSRDVELKQGHKLVERDSAATDPVAALQALGGGKTVAATFKGLSPDGVSIDPGVGPEPIEITSMDLIFGERK
jgi:hypothetical protein